MRKRQSGKEGKSGMVFTYHEDIGVLDTQEIFDSVIANGHDMYEFHAGLSGIPTVEDRISILDRLNSVINVIQYRVFCHEFRLSYVGSSGNEAQSMTLIISECAKALTYVKMS